MANMYINALTALWNAIGTTYSAIKMDVTDGGSAADSKLLDLRVNTVPKFTVDKDGDLVTTGSITAAGTITSSSSSTVNTPLLAMPTGGAINWNTGDVTITHSSNLLAFAGGSSGYSFDAVVKPAANDGAALGASGTAWSDLYLASGGVIDFNGGDILLTHTANTLTLSGGTLVATNFSMGTTNGATFTITDTNSSGAAGPVVDLVRSGGAGSAGYLLGEVTFRGRNASNTSVEYVKVYGRIDDPTAGSEDGALLFTFLQNGVLTAKVTFSNSYAFFSAPVYPNQGVQFPPTQNAVVDVNTLDDYEEMTFTPTIRGDGTAGTGTYTSQIGQATKIGRMVFFTTNVTWTAHSGSGNLEVVLGTLPSAANNIAYPMTVSSDNITLPAICLTGFIPFSGNYVVVQYPVTNAASTDLPLDTAGSIKISGSYFVAT